MSFVKLHRKILEWEWYKDPNTFRLFIHLLLNANYENRSWQGATIMRGQLITGRKKLADQLRLSEQEIRTSLDKLKSTNEITIQSTNRFSIVTICKWEDYQGKVKVNQPAEQPTVDQTSNQQSTTTKEYKGREEEKKGIYRAFANLKITVAEFEKLVSDGYSKEQIDGILDDIENYKGNKKYTSLNLTARKWLKKQYPEAHPPKATSEKPDVFDLLTQQRLKSIHNN